MRTTLNVNHCPPHTNMHVHMYVYLHTWTHTHREERMTKSYMRKFSTPPVRKEMQIKTTVSWGWCHALIISTWEAKNRRSL